LNIVQPLKLIKTVTVENVDQKQTLVILPHGYMLQFSPEHKVSFKELDRGSTLLTLVGPTERAYSKLYRLVPNNGSYQVSVPRGWLRNIGARHGDLLDIYTTAHPGHLVAKLRKMIS
jgi:hypothetical protein